MKCQECGSTGPFLVESTVTARVTGRRQEMKTAFGRSSTMLLSTKATTKPEWSSESFAVCEECEASYPFKEFLGFSVHHREEE